MSHLVDISIYCDPFQCANFVVIFLAQFDAKKMGDIEITENFRKTLVHNLDGVHFTFVKMSEAYHDCLRYYIDMLQNAIANSDSYLSENDLVKLQQNTKKESQLMVCNLFIRRHVFHFDINAKHFSLS